MPLSLASGNCQESLEFFGLFLQRGITSTLLYPNIHMVFILPFGYLCPNFLFLMRTPLTWDLGLTLTKYNLILTWLHLQRPYFLIRSYYRFKMDIDFWKTLFHPVQMLTPF